MLFTTTGRGMPLSGSGCLSLGQKHASEAATLSFAETLLDKNAFLDELWIRKGS